MADEVKNEKSESASVTPEVKKTASKDAKPKTKKPNKVGAFFKKIGKFFKECKVELKKIVWASAPSTLKNTVLVTIVILLFAAVLFGLDLLFRDVIIDWLGKIPTLIANLGWG